MTTKELWEYILNNKKIIRIIYCAGYSVRPYRDFIYKQPLAEIKKELLWEVVWGDITPPEAYHKLKIGNTR